MKIFYLFIICSLIQPISRAGATGSVFFIENSEHRYIRTPASNDVDQTQSLLLQEVGAAVSVLLGLEPPTTLSAAGSIKLNKVLSPNPFDKPRAVITFEIGVDDALIVDLDHSFFSKALRSKVSLDSSTADIQLPDEDELSMVSLNDKRIDCTDEEITEFASWLGGSYVTETMAPLNGVLSISLDNSVKMNLHLSKKGEREFVLNLLALWDNVRREILTNEDLPQNIQRRAELFVGYFDGIKALREEYGADYVAKQEMRLFLATLSKIFYSLQTAYKGQIVGVVLLKGTQSQQSNTLLNVKCTSHLSARLLAETKSSTNSTSLIAEVVLVRRVLALVTGLVLIIATLMGVYFLLNMPLTRDTLLYSNVKLD